MNYRSISDISTCIRSNIHRIPQDVDLIVGIPRSGLLAASVIALHLNIPIIDLEGFVENRKIKYGRTRAIKNPGIITPKHAKHILVVDDSVWSGKSMATAVKLVETANHGCRHTTCAVYASNGGTRGLDIYFEKVAMPRAFEWNIFHKRTLEECCVDIDGVLCVDPTASENDDGERYKRFLLNATPLMLPSTKIGVLVTSRLEKYRRETQQWLEKNRIEYHDLVMLDLPDAATRRKLRIHGKFKAEVYRKYPGAHLFIESEPRQAIEIAQLSGRSVLCFADQRIYRPGTSLKAINSGFRKFGVRGYNKVKRLGWKVFQHV